MGRRCEVGFLGLGIMGSRMASRVLAAGWPLTVWNRSKIRLEPFEAKGVHIAETPAEVAGRAEIVALSLFDTAAVEEVLFAPSGVAAARGGPCRLVVDHSTILPEGARTIEGWLSRESGIGFIDAPVTGGPVGAAEGTLGIFAGGLEDEIELARPVVEAYAGRFVRMGPSGAGAATKMVNQIAVMNGIPLLAEMIKLAQANDVEASRLPEVLAGGFADSRVLQVFGPRMAVRDEKTWSQLATGMKDLDLILETARTSGVSLPHTALSQQLWRLLIGRGLGEADISQFVRLYE